MNLRNLKYKAFLASLLSLMLFFALSVTLVSGQTSPTGGGGTSPTGGGDTNPTGSGGTTIPNPFNCGGADPCTLFTFLEAIVNNIIMPIGVVLAVLAFIYTGFLYVTAQGNASQIGKAHTALRNSIIGTAILLGAWSIATVIRNTVDQLTN
jgi:hypothetical protein